MRAMRARVKCEEYGRGPSGQRQDSRVKTALIKDGWTITADPFALLETWILKRYGRRTNDRCRARNESLLSKSLAILHPRLTNAPQAYGNSSLLKE